MDILKLAVAALSLLLSLILGIVGFFTKRLLSDVDELKREVHDFMVDSTRTYATKKEMSELVAATMNRLEASIREIRDDIKYMMRSQMNKGDD